MFRKRFNTILKINNDVNSNIAEKLMAHKRGLDGTYLQPTREECFLEFVKAIPDLMIDDSARKQAEIEKLQQNQKNSQDQSIKIKKLEEKLEKITNKIDLFTNTIEYQKLVNKN